MLYRHKKQSEVLHRSFVTASCIAYSVYGPWGWQYQVVVVFCRKRHWRMRKEGYPEILKQNLKASARRSYSKTMTLSYFQSYNRMV